MGKTAPNGFSLIELLVVITLMALVGAYALSNYGTFGEDQKLKNAVLDVVSLLRQAQTNATANVECNSQYGATWRVVGASNNVYLGCRPSNGDFITKKTVQLGTNINIRSVSGTNCSSLLSVDFAPVTGNISFPSPGCTSLTVAIANSKISPNCIEDNLAKCRSLKIEKGGRIYAQ